jgi:apolipoprotein D and lipocalin family protein
MKKLYSLVLLSLLLAVTGCTGLPEGVTAVNRFDVNRYVGHWYEVARLDHRFEEGLTDVSATYTVRDDGGLKVVNRGYDAEAGKWTEVEGKAYFMGDKTVGMLKVSFFGPFYGGYNIIALDQESHQESYQYSLVSGPDRSYLWILARTPTISPEVSEKLVAVASDYGFATDQLIWVTHAQKRME